MDTEELIQVLHTNILLGFVLDQNYYYGTNT